jgi:predicted nucleotidyltransferase
LTLGGSTVAGGIDEFSDLDFVVACRDDDHTALLAEAQLLAGRLRSLVASFTGEHVAVVAC